MQIKRVFALVVSIFLVFFFSLQLNAAVKPNLVFKKTVIDAGKVKMNGKKTIEYEFKNKGKGKLVLIKAFSSCACTSVEIPSDPFPKGKKGKILVTYDSKGILPGKYKKNITIIANTPESSHELELIVQIVP